MRHAEGSKAESKHLKRLQDSTACFARRLVRMTNSSLQIKQSFQMPVVNILFNTLPDDLGIFFKL